MTPLVLIIAMSLSPGSGCGPAPGGVPAAQKNGGTDGSKEGGRKDEKKDADSGKAAPKARKRPAPPASRERVRSRERMVERQIAGALFGRTPVKSEVVLDALRAVPRHVFVPLSLRSRAYDDTPLPIGHGQTISQPYIVAWMTELLELEPDSRVLEIGTGSGYQAAVLAHLTPHVYTVEIVEPIHRRAKKALAKQGYDEIECRLGDGYHGWAEKGPFDAIIVTCAAGHLPPPLWEQLKPGGRIVIPIGAAYEVQRLVVVTKTPEGRRRSKTIADVRFVPLTRPPAEADGER